MNDATHDPDGPVLRVVHDADAAPDADGTVDQASAQGSDETSDEARDPLLARAERIAELPLRERPAAFDGLNRAVAAELQTLEEG